MVSHLNSILFMINIKSTNVVCKCKTIGEEESHWRVDSQFI